MCHSRLAGPLWIIPSWNAWRIQMPRSWHASHAWGPMVHEAGRLGMEIGWGTVLSGGSRCCSGGVNWRVSNAATPSIHTPAWLREQVRRGTKGSVQNPRLEEALIQIFIINTKWRPGCETMRMFLQPYTNTVQCPLWSLSQRTAVPAWMPLCKQ